MIPHSGGTTKHRRRVRLGAVLVLVAVAAITLATTASAGGQLFRELIDEEESAVEVDFCGIEGLTVEFATHRVGMAHAVPHGPDGLVYFGFQLEGDRCGHEPCERQLRDVGGHRQGQGSTGNGQRRRHTHDPRPHDRQRGLYGEDGKAIARNPGQVRFEILIDHGGTPTDPSDDEFLEFLGEVKGSTGRSDDFCEAAVPVLLGS